MSSRTANMVPSVVNRAAACSPPVVAKTFCAERSLSGRPASVVDSMVDGSSPGEKRLMVRTASSDPLPQTPQDEVV
ncbi:Uncharacterised protein [Mycobacteroides abscessus subsp. massiliense]|nr:Uncharacterised protein [Mycobacteroides abscessus subsp. massiliense]